MNTQTASFGFFAAVVITAGSFYIANSFTQSPAGVSSLAITADATTSSSSSSSTSTSQITTTSSTARQSSTTASTTPGSSTTGTSIPVAPPTTTARSTTTALPTSTLASTTSTLVASTPSTSAPASTSTTDPASTTTTDPANTTTTDPTSSSTTASVTPEGRGQAALAQIAYPWQQKLPGWTIEFHPERKGYYGLTLVDQKRIEVYVRNDESTGLLAHVIAHELGHAVDVTLNSGDDRRQWQEARSITGSPWWPSSAASDFSTGAGDFAESFAAWQVGGGSFRSNLGGVPNEAQLAVMAELASN